MMAGIAIHDQTIETIWTELESGLDSIFKKQDRVSPMRYMELYTSVFNYCTKMQEEVQQQQSQHGKGSNSKRDRGGNQQHGIGEFVGGELYNRLRKFVTEYAGELLEICRMLNGEQLLEQYTTLWTKFQFSATVVNGIFAYLNRHWIRRAMDEGRPNVYEAYNLSVYVWKITIFEELHHNITAALLNLIKQERNGEKITTRLISGAIASYIELGINNIPHDLRNDDASSERDRLISAKHSKLDVYRTFFQERFLEETKQFYIGESVNFIQNNSVVEYMKKVEHRLGEERDRCELYLDNSTQDPLANACETVLIKHQLELLQSEFQPLLRLQLNEDLGRMYNLCQRVPDALISLRKVLEDFAEREGLASVQQTAETALNDSKQYVNSILDVYRRFNTLVTVYFRQDVGFVQAMDKAFTKFINENRVTTMAKTNTKSPELLARYCDILLRKSSRNPDEVEMDTLLNDIMVIFKYIEDKDVFLKFYSKMLGKRLVTDSSASDEAESSMIGRLKQMCGFEYTTKLQRMFTDSGLSKEISENFRKQAGDDCIDFTIKILASSVWPYTPTQIFEIPKPLTECIDRFTLFYNKAHSGRKLSWLLSLGRGELVAYAFQKKYTFVCTTAQMTVLTLFNNATEIGYTDLARDTKLEVNPINVQSQGLDQVLRSLLKAELLKTSEGDAEFAPETEFTLNLNYSNKKLKVDITRMLMAPKEVTKRETEEVQKSVEEDRKLVIQAAIVRIMKMRKTLKHQQLLAEVLQQLSIRFQPKVPVIKACIDTLIEKEYIKRLENDRDSYEYLA